MVLGIVSFSYPRRLTAAEAMAHPFFDEHIKDFGPRTPEAEKPADAGTCSPPKNNAKQTDCVLYFHYERSIPPSLSGSDLGS
jgi:hypothetical protein